MTIASVVFSAFYLAASIIGIFLCLILWTDKRRSPARNWLTALLLTTVAVLINSVIIDLRLFRLWPHAFHLFLPLWLLLPALLFMYSQSYTKPEFRLRWLDIFHLLPFITYSILWGRIFYPLTAEQKLQIAEYSLNAEYEVSLFSLCFFLPAYAYLLWLWFQQWPLSASRRLWLRNVWLFWLIVILFDSGLSLIAVIADIDVSHGKSFTILCFSFLHFYAAWQLLKKPGLFFLRISKYGSTSISHEKLQQFAKDADQLMQSEGWYLRSDLRQKQVADQLGINSVVFSQVLNTVFQENFNQWVNRYRIQKAQSLIQEGYLNRFYIDALAGQVGFSSKASFYRHFREQVGQTPLAYWKAIQQKAKS